MTPRQRREAGLNVLLAALHKYGEGPYRSLAGATGIPVGSVHRAVERAMEDPQAVLLAAALLRIGGARISLNSGDSGPRR